MKKLQKILILCCVLVCFISTNVFAATPEQSEDFAINAQDSEKENMTDVQVEGVVERNAKMIENRDEIKVTETTGADTIASCKEVNGIQTASATNEISAIMYNLQSDYIDVGALYTTNDPNPQFRWLEYNLNTKTWRVFDNWRSGNWASWKTSVGDYWLQCEMKTSDGQVVIRTAEFHYTAGNLKITGIYAGATEANDTTMLFGMTSNLSNVKYSFKIYNVATGKWSALTYLDTKQWIEWAAKTGSYWIQYELYTSDGRMADYKTHVFSSTEPVRRALLLANDDNMGQIRFENNVKNLYNAFSRGHFWGKSFDRVDKVVNVSKAEIINRIKTTFANTTENDISYLYFSCHGVLGTGDLCIGVDGRRISSTELRQILDANVKGKVVVMASSCFSGNLIQDSSNIENGQSEIFNGWMEEFISAFEEPVTDSGELAVPKYLVLCSASKDEYSYAQYDISYAAECWGEGMGWSFDGQKVINMKADTNNDGKVTLNELYAYSYKILSNLGIEASHPASYPSNSQFVIFGKY